MISHNNGVNVFRCPTLKIVCTFVLVWMRSSILCYSTWGWIIFTVWGYHFLYIRGSIWEFKSHVIRFLPLLLSFGEKSGWIRYLHSCCILVIWCSDIFILCKCMWQICNVLQIYDWTSCSNFLSTWIWGLNVYDISTLFIGIHCGTISP
jgi:hypothetical protein